MTIVPIHRIAVCGAGAAGLNVVKNLRKRATPDAPIHVDLFEASLVPGGLIRHGVAPDHGEVRKIGTSLIDSLSQNPKPDAFILDFFGGVRLGRWLHLSGLRKAYDAVILATGSVAASSPSLGISQENADGVVTAREVVRLYNGQPLVCPTSLYDLYERVPGVMAEAGQWTVDAKLLDYSLARSSSATSQDPKKLSRSQEQKFGHFFKPQGQDKDLCIIGQGNVSTDIARILLTDPKRLPRHLLPQEGLEKLRQVHSRHIPNVHILGRRGALQAAWDTAALRELFTMDGKVKVLVKPSELEASLAHPSVAKELKRNRATQRMLALLEEGAANYVALNDFTDTDLTTDPRLKDLTRIHLRFLLTPTKIHTLPNQSKIANAVSVVRSELMMPSHGTKLRDLVAQPVPLAPVETIGGLSLIVKSLGFGKSGQANLAPWKFADPGTPPDVKSSHKEEEVIERGWLDSLVGGRGSTGGKIYSRNENLGCAVYATGWARSSGLGNLADTIASSTAVAKEVLTDLKVNGVGGKVNGVGGKVNGVGGKVGGVQIPVEKEVFSSGGQMRHLEADLLCLKLTVPEIGIPLDWDESMELLRREALYNDKISSWKRGADIVNMLRDAHGPRSAQWQTRINRIKPQCLDSAHAHY